jgi:hypothetical protein
MDVKQKIVQEVLLAISRASRGLGIDTAYMDADLTASDEKYLEMSRDEISALMTQAFTAGDFQRWGYLAERYLDKCSTEELTIRNATFLYLTQAFIGVSPLKHPRPELIVSEAYEKAKVEMLAA